MKGACSHCHASHVCPDVIETFVFSSFFAFYFVFPSPTQMSQQYSKIDRYLLLSDYGFDQPVFHKILTKMLCNRSKALEGRTEGSLP